MRKLCIVMILALSAGLVRAAPPGRVDGADAAVARALAFLQHSQSTDGAWRVGNRKDAAITSLAVMAFLSAGHVPGEGKYGATVDKGIRWVLSAQRPNGIIATQGNWEMYHQGICTLMLAEVAGMTDARLAPEVRSKLEKAVKVILRAQRTQGEDAGGWRYRVQGTDADISVTGWQVMALRAAKNLGCDVPPESIERAIRFIERCRDPQSGGFRYRPREHVTIPCTGTSILALEICGKEQHGRPELLRAGSYILKNPPWHAGHTFYGIYYCTQALYQLGDNYWTTYRPRLHEELLRRQEPSGAWSGEVSRNYCSSMAILALTVDYGFLPIYQRGESAKPPTGHE